MNTATVVGHIHKWNADMRTIQGSGTRFLTCIVSYEKKFPNGKRFTEKFKVLMFGKHAETLCPQLKAGTLVAITGEVSLDKPKEDDEKREPMLKIVGNVSVIDTGSSIPTNAPIENASISNRSVPATKNEDIPF